MSSPRKSNFWLIGNNNQNDSSRPSFYCFVQYKSFCCSPLNKTTKPSVYWTICSKFMKLIHKSGVSKKEVRFFINKEKIHELLNIKTIERKYEYYVRFLKTLKNQPFPKDLVVDLIGYYLRRDEFTKAESHVL